jgi:hypothetical protein
MSKAVIETTGISPSPTILRLTEREVQALADRLFSRGISVLSLDRPEHRSDLITASRTLRALLRVYEQSAGRQLQTVLLCGEVV